MTKHRSNTASDELITGRIALSLSYNGTAYHGWQSQKDGLPTVQQVLEEALSVVANQRISLTCAGRTDRSVHASHQVVHFDTTARRSRRSWILGCNANLPHDVSVTWVGAVADDFHARFSAISRRYLYCIYNHPVRSASFASEMTWCHYPLNEVLMHQAAQSLVGEHDFSSYRAAGCQAKSPIRIMEFVNVMRIANMVVIDIKGNAFLHHMVRNIAGVLMSVGRGVQPVAWSKTVLDAKDRARGDVTAPPYGLYLSHVDYPSEFNIPASAGAPGFAQAMMVASGHLKYNQDGLWDNGLQKLSSASE